MLHLDAKDGEKAGTCGGPDSLAGGARLRDGGQSRMSVRASRVLVIELEQARLRGSIATFGAALTGHKPADAAAYAASKTAPLLAR